MLKIKEVIVVEGRYDKNALSQVVDGVIFETSGFGIMKDKQLLSLLRKAAQAKGLIVLTDSDGAGFVIRNYIKSAIDPNLVKHAYIPDIAGKEKRKTSPGREGLLGVEGMRPEVIMESLRRAGATIEGESNKTYPSQITKQDLMDLGLSGGANSSFLRKALLEKLDLPRHMSANAMLQALNLLYTLPQLKDLVAALVMEHD